MTEELNFAVCVLFFERVHQTVDCVRSFSSTGRRLYVLNNGSLPQSRDTFIREVADLPNVVLLDSPTNLGVACGRNRLIEASSEPWLLFVDSDIVVETPDWDEQFARSVARFPEAEVFAPSLYNVHEAAEEYRVRLIVNKGALEMPRASPTEETNAFPGGASLIRRSLFHRLGAYEKHMHVGFEDYEFALRGIKTGNPVRVRAVPSVRFLHEHLVAETKEDKRAARARYNPYAIVKSFLLYTEKHGVTRRMGGFHWVRAQRAQMKVGDFGVPTRVLIWVLSWALRIRAVFAEK